MQQGSQIAFVAVPLAFTQPPRHTPYAQPHAASLLLQESAPGPEFIPTLAAAVVAMARYSEEVFAQPLLSVPTACGVEPYLQPVAALAIITPCALGPLLAVFSFTSGPTPYMQFLAAKVPWSYILVSCCSMFGARPAHTVLTLYFLQGRLACVAARVLDSLQAPCSFARGCAAAVLHAALNLANVQ